MHKLLLCAFIACGHITVAFANDVDLSDPTRPSGFSNHVAAHTDNEKLSLTLIRLGPKPLAVINGKNIAPGESIAGYRLVSLQMTSATLARGSQRIVLKLAPTIRKSNSYHFSQNR